MTGSVITVVGSSTKIYKAFYYDIKGQMVKSVQNNLLSGYDITSSVYTFSGKPATVTHTHTANGNLTQDLNKSIKGITYNVLNLPNVVTFSDGSTITYTYAADGTKLRTIHKIGSTTTTTDYCGNVIYENGTQKFLLTGEGYVNLTGTQKYHYYLKDHQGNNRAVINQSGAVEETSNYYPFGGLFASTNNIQLYKYNGKEYDTKRGLNWYDYGARMYDPTVGRFTTVDPMAEKYYGINPYAYCGNNPISRIDPDGRDWRVQTHYNEETKKIEYTMTVNAALYNTSNQSIDMMKLSDAITKQVTNAYNISGENFEVKMNFNLRVVNSVKEIGKREHVIQVINQDEVGSSRPDTRGRANTRMNGLDIKVGTNAVSDMLNGNDNRTIAHELGHTGGLKHKGKGEDIHNLMQQKISIDGFKGVNPLTTNKLERYQIENIRNHYIHNQLNKRINQ